MRAAVAAWVGSPNAGDELVHAGLRRHLGDLGVEPVVLPRGRLFAAVARGPAAGVDALVLGGGGIVNDFTSAANLPYHLAPVLAARVPSVGVGLGVGPLTGDVGRRLARVALARLQGLAVRDGPSADLLASTGLARPVVAADLALNLPRPEVEVDDVVVAALRPWDDRRRRLPVAVRPSAAAVDEGLAARAAVALDAVAARTGLGVRLVALEAPKDAPLARAVADRLRAPAEVVCPAPLDVPAAVGRGRVVVAHRYHAGIAAALARRPLVLLAYSMKVHGLAADLDVQALRWQLDRPDELAAAAVDALDRSPDEIESRVADLQQRERRNREVLERLLQP